MNYIFHYENCDFHKEQYVKRLLNNEAVAFLISERPTEKNIVSETFPIGESKVSVDVREIKAGAYFYQIETSYFKDAKKIVIKR